MLKWQILYFNNPQNLSDEKLGPFHTVCVQNTFNCLRYNHFFQYHFSAYAKSGIIRKGEIVPFKKFNVNSGDTFNLTTSTFTAPVSGIYEFTFSGFTGDSEYDSCRVVAIKNGNETIHGMYNEGPYGKLVSTWMIALDAEETLNLKVTSGQGLYADKVLSGKLIEITP